MNLNSYGHQKVGSNSCFHLKEKKPNISKKILK